MGLNHRYCACFIPLVLTMTLSCLFSAGCDRKPEQPHTGVVVTIFPVFDLTRQIAGPDISVSLLMQPGASEHAFDPTPADLMTLSSAGLLIACGDGIDEWVAPAYHQRQGEGLRLLLLNAVLDFPIGSFGQADVHAHGHHHDDSSDHEHDHGSETLNPHQWLVPKSAMMFVVAIRDELTRMHPDKATGLAERAAALLADLEAIDREYSAALAPLPDKRIITFHDAFSGLAEPYGIQVSASFFNIHSNQVTPAALSEVVTQIEKAGVRAVYVEPQINSDVVTRLRQQVTLRILDPIGDPNRPGYETYQNLMRTNLSNLIDGLLENDRPAGGGHGG